MTWKLMETDTFDPERPVTFRCSGEGLAEGLELFWAVLLVEGLTDAGAMTFSVFHLELETEAATTLISAPVHAFDNPGLRRLREWVLETPGSILPELLGQAHFALLARSGRTLAGGGDTVAEARELLRLLEIARGREDYLEALRSLAGAG